MTGSAFAEPLGEGACPLIWGKVVARDEGSPGSSAALRAPTQRATSTQPSDEPQQQVGAEPDPILIRGDAARDPRAIPVLGDAGVDNLAYGRSCARIKSYIIVQRREPHGWSEARGNGQGARITLAVDVVLERPPTVKALSEAQPNAERAVGFALSQSCSGVRF